MSDPTKPIDYCAIPHTDQIILSPEGVEEKVVLVEGILITMTQNGKFRVYIMCPNPEHTMHGIGVCDDKVAANKMGMSALAMTVGMELDPINTMRTLLNRAPKS